MMNAYINRIRFLLSFGHPVAIRDIATLTFTSENEVLSAMEELQTMGINVWCDGNTAEIRGG